MLNQDSATQIPLHPIAIGGFLGLIIHALDLVPVGSTDGGRISQAILGRVWHLTFSSLVFSSHCLSHHLRRIVPYCLGIYSFTVLRNEIWKSRVLSTWLIAALILVPLR